MLLPTTQILYNQFLQITSYYNSNYNTANTQQNYNLSVVVASTLNKLKQAVYASVVPITLSNIVLVLEATDLVSIDQYYADLIINRVSAFNKTNQLILKLNIGNIPFNINNLQDGSVPANYPSFIDLFMNTSLETAPAGIDYLNFQTHINDMYIAFSTLLNALITQGAAYTGIQYDTVNMLSDVCENISNNLSNISINPEDNIQYAWNNLSYVPCMFKFFTMAIGDPTNGYYQSTNTFIYIIDNLYQTITNYILSLNSSKNSSINMSIVYSKDTLMTFASRNMGDFSSWYTVALQNNLQPPFVSQSPLIGTASPGTNLQIPISASPSPSIGNNNTNPITSYELQYLGTDIYLGNIGQPMPPWNGDFYVIYGYPNLALSLGRALITPQGSLMYEPSFGSEIPSLIGGIQSFDTIGYISAYASSTIQSDPRVSSVSNGTISIAGTSMIAYNGVVIPNGQNANSIAINQVFSSIGF